MSRFAWRLATCLAVSNVLAGVTLLTLPAASATAKAKPSGTINWGFASIPTSLNPYTFVAPPQTYFFHALYDGLTAMNNRGNVIPALAASWTHTLSDMSYTFTLRNGVKFSDGSSLTASAVAADLTYLASTPSLSLYSEAADIAKVVASGKKVTITLDTQDPLLLQQLTAIPIPAPSYVANPSSFTTTADGTGPYKLSAFNPGTSVTLVANPKTWQPQPKTETQNFESIPSEATRVAALESGQIDIAQSMSPDDSAALRQAGETSIAVKRAQIQFIGFEVTGSGANTPITNVDVRKAMNYAIDAPTIIKTILGGVFAPAHGQVVNSDGFGYNPAVKAYPYDPTKAKHLLAAAGYPNGFKITMEETVGAFPNDQEAYQAVANYLDAVGIQVTINIVPLTTFVSALRAGPRDPLFIEGLQYLPELDTTKAMQWFLCNEPSGPTADRFCDPKLDALIKQSYLDHSVAARKKALEAANALWHNDAPAVPLWELTDIWGVNKNLSGWQYRHDAVLPLSTLKLG